MKDRKQANLRNDERNRHAEALTDLPLRDEQAEQTKAGAGTELFRESIWGEGKKVKIDL